MPTRVLASLVALTLLALSARAEDKPATRFFEMRTYSANVGMLDARYARFREHTIALFK